MSVLVKLIKSLRFLEPLGARGFGLMARG
ncbi:hypothetical protein CP03DC29_0567A, partial [Chlamydia psittaci 03DC29]